MPTIHAETALLPDGWMENVLIDLGDDGRIATVTQHVTGTAAEIHVSCLLPAPVNAHSHAFQRAMAGLTEHRSNNSTDSFWTWRELMYRFLDQLTPDHVEAIAALVQMEMLESGYATNVEFHYLHHAPDGNAYDNQSEMAERIMAATATTGIGLTMLPVHYQYGGCDMRPLARGQCRFHNDLDGFAALCDGVRNGLGNLPADTVFGVAPHSLRAVSASSLDFTRQLADGGPFHMHLAEQSAEVEEVCHTLAHVRLSGFWIISRQAPIAVLSIARKCNRTRQAGLRQAVPLQGYARLPRLVLAMVFLMGLAGLTRAG